jgi:hypothetical protein
MAAEMLPSSDPAGSEWISRSNDGFVGSANSGLWPDFAFTRPDRFQLFLDVFATNGVGMC